MKICIIGKFPPIQGGVSAQTYWTAHELASRGHEVYIITNADEIEYGFRELFLPDDNPKTSSSYASGGRVLCYNTTTIRGESYIPWANPFVSKLFGLGLEVIERHGCDIILGWYLEPYGFTAGLLSKVTGIPALIRHAGSDVGRLAHHPNLRNNYQWLFKQVRGIITSRRVSGILTELGADQDKFIFPTASKLPSIFSSTTKPLNIEEYREAAIDYYKLYPLSEEIKQGLTFLCDKRFEEGLPVIGMYGKVGATKGTYDLISVLSSIAQKGQKFIFFNIACGRFATLKEYYSTILKYRELVKRTFILPPLPPWRIPAYLKCCDVVCFLENDFTISFHAPLIPREILSSGATLVCSNEIADKQFFKENLVDGKNFISIPNPKDHHILESKILELLNNRRVCKTIGRHGLYLSNFYEENLLPSHSFVSVIEDFLKSKKSNQ